MSRNRKPANKAMGWPTGGTGFGLASFGGRLLLDEAATGGTTAPASTAAEGAQSQSTSAGQGQQNQPTGQTGQQQQTAQQPQQQQAGDAAANAANRLQTAMDAALTPVTQAIAGFQTAVGEMTQRIEGLEQQNQQGNQNGNRPAPFSVRQGEDIMSSRGYECRRIVQALNPQSGFDPGQAKVELELSQRLRRLYQYADGPGTNGGVLMPICSRLIGQAVDVEGTDQYTGIAVECQQMMAAGVQNQGIADAYQQLVERSRGTQFESQALNMFNDAEGGLLLGETQTGELIELLQPREVMNGCREVPLGPNGQIKLPKDTADVTGGYVGMGAAGDTLRAGTESNPTQDHVIFASKKQWFISRLPNELIRFPSVSGEFWVRNSIVRSAAKLSNATFVAGVGGNLVPLGFISQSGVNLVVASTVGANGNTVQPEDIDEFVSAIEEQDVDEVDAESIVLMMRPALWTKIRNRRADAVSAADAAGPFVFLDAAMNEALGRRNLLRGRPVRKSTHIPNDRVKGGGSDLTMILAVCLNQYVHARQGVFELLSSNTADGAFTRDETLVRGFQYHDMGPLRAECHAKMDTLVVG